MKAVLSNQPVTVKSQYMPELVDHRYFYDEMTLNLGRCGMLYMWLSRQSHWYDATCDEQSAFC